MERFRCEKKVWPNSPDQLCPQYLAAELLDPFDGKPLRYRRIEVGVAIYSVGQDGVDNSGDFPPTSMVIRRTRTSAFAYGTWTSAASRRIRNRLKKKNPGEPSWKSRTNYPKPPTALRDQDRALKVIGWGLLILALLAIIGVFWKQTRMESKNCRKRWPSGWNAPNRAGIGGH